MEQGEMREILLITEAVETVAPIRAKEKTDLMKSYMYTSTIKKTSRFAYQSSYSFF